MTMPAGLLTQLVAEIEALTERAERAETALRLLANGLHTPPDEPGDISDGVTVHAWSPGHPMGCIVCFALDEILSRAALGETAPPPNPFLQPNPAVPEVIWGEENPHEEDRPPPRSFGETAPSATAGMTPDEREKWYGGVGYPDP